MARADYDFSATPDRPLAKANRRRELAAVGFARFEERHKKEHGDPGWRGVGRGKQPKSPCNRVRLCRSAASLVTA